MSWFKPEEFWCPCDYPDCDGKRDADARLRLKLEQMRELYGQPLVVNSGWRCPRHNADVGGAENSEHMQGTGADLVVPGSRARFLMIRAALKAGFVRLGVGKRFLHVGASETHDQDVVWVY